MPETEPPGHGDFTTNLRWLFANVPGPDGALLTTEQFVRLVPEQGLDVKISMGYASQLRRGSRARPTGDLLEAISRVFAVPSTFFFDARTNEAVRSGVTHLEEARREAFHSFAASLDSLTPDQLKRIQAILSSRRDAGGDAAH